jgi:hypothetical protein
MTTPGDYWMTADTLILIRQKTPKNALSFMLQRTRPMWIRTNVDEIQHRQDEDCSSKNELQHGVLLFSDAVHTGGIATPMPAGSPQENGSMIRTNYSEKQ